MVRALSTSLSIVKLAAITLVTFTALLPNICHGAQESPEEYVELLEKLTNFARNHLSSEFAPKFDMRAADSLRGKTILFHFASPLADECAEPGNIASIQRVDFTEERYLVVFCESDINTLRQLSMTRLALSIWSNLNGSLIGDFLIKQAEAFYARTLVSIHREFRYEHRLTTPCDGLWLAYLLSQGLTPDSCSSKVPWKTVQDANIWFFGITRETQRKLGIEKPPTKLSADEYSDTYAALMLSNAVSFAAAHEIGHLVLNHLTQPSPDGHAAMEIAADRFAAAAMDAEVTLSFALSAIALWEIATPSGAHAERRRALTRLVFCGSDPLIRASSRFEAETRRSFPTAAAMKECS